MFCFTVSRTHGLSVFLLASLSVSCVPRSAALEVTAVPSELGAVVSVGDEPFAEYRTRSGYQPVIWPIVGPTGKRMTRSYPVGTRQDGEMRDHPHHRSLWFSHGDVNGLDFWGEFEKVSPQELEDRPLIAHRRFLKIGQEGLRGVVMSENDWMSKGTKVLEDQRTIYFGAEQGLRWIDFTIVLKASDQAVTFGDTKEGTFGIRVPAAMKVDAKLGGQIVNSEGQRGEAAWGQPARWVEYYGPVQGETMGITIVNHPSSFAYPTRWHVRTYGLFAANPFGELQFPAANKRQGAKTLQHGEAITLRYLVFFYPGQATATQIDEHLEKSLRSP